MNLVLSVPCSGTFFVVEFIGNHQCYPAMHHFDKFTINKFYKFNGKIVIPFRKIEYVVKSNIRNGASRKLLIESYQAMIDFCKMRKDMWFVDINCNPEDRFNVLLGLHDYLGFSNKRLTEDWAERWPIINSNI